MKLMNSSGVLTADSFNLSIFRQIWLIENSILTRAETEESPDSCFSPVAVNVETEQFEFLVVPERAQVRAGGEAATGLFARVLGGIAKALPHTPYQGIGLNREYMFEVRDKSVFNNIKACFVPERSPLSQFFSEPDSRYGTYMSQNISPEVRLRLDAKPVAFQSGTEAVFFKFNIHRNLGREDYIKGVEDFLSLESEYKRICEDVVKELDQYLGE